MLKRQRGLEEAGQPVTLRDIAERAGVSQGAVSMALSDHPRIGADTKRTIRRIADELGYVPNSAGRALRVRRTDVIGLVVPQTGEHVFGHPYFMYLLVGVTAAANAHDSTVMVSTNASYQHGMTAYERVLHSGAVEGAIVTSAAVDDPDIARLVASSMPIVLIGHYPNHTNTVSVWIDDQSASANITSHLLHDHGLRNLGHISGPLTHQTALDRYAGFQAACSAAEATVQHVLVEGDFGEDSGYAGTLRLLSMMPNLDGIVAANDEMAFGALRALRDSGLNVPQDVAVVGFDDFGVSRLTTPAITTVRVPATEIGQVAAEKLFNVIAGDNADERRFTLPAELVVRQSCGEHHQTDGSPSDPSTHPMNQ